MAERRARGTDPPASPSRAAGPVPRPHTDSGQPTPVGRIYIGTSAFSEPGWRGRFYPPDLSPEGMLTYYAEHLAAVELNYHRLKPVGYVATESRNGAEAR